LDIERNSVAVSLFNIVDESLEPQMQEIRSTSERSKTRILVVDDNKDSGDTLSLVLRAKGHEVRTARDGQQAIDLTPEFRPNIILMDVGMPKLNGYDTTRFIRELDSGKDVTIVAVTGWSEAEDFQQSKAAGCSAHMTKPVDFAALDRLIAGILASPQISGN
jgi:CheY-like chemotaxis protein